MLFASRTEAHYAAVAVSGVMYRPNSVLTAEFAKQNLLLNQPRAVRPLRVLPYPQPGKQLN